MRKWIGVALAALLVLLAFGAILLFEIARADSGPITGTVAFVLALGFLAFLRFVPVEQLLRALDAFRFAAPVFAYVITSIFVGSRKATMEFDEIGAQVIVVLLLALAVEARFFRIRAGVERLELASIFFTLLVLAAGEYYALNGLLTGRPAPAEMIGGAIAAGFAAIGVGALLGPRRSEG